MKNIFLTLFAFFSCIACTKAQKTSFNEVALKEKLISYTNQEIDLSKILSQHQGKTIVIEIWASWCGDCIKAMPKLKRLQDENSDVDYVFISMDKTVEKWKAGIEKHEIKGDHYMAKDGMKGVFGKSIDLDWIPRYIIIDKTGKIVTYRAIETDFEQINTTLKSIK